MQNNYDETTRDMFQDLLPKLERAVIKKKRRRYVTPIARCFTRRQFNKWYVNRLFKGMD